MNDGEQSVQRLLEKTWELTGRQLAKHRRNHKGSEDLACRVFSEYCFSVHISSFPELAKAFQPGLDKEIAACERWLQKQEPEALEKLFRVKLEINTGDGCPEELENEPLLDILDNDGIDVYDR